MSRAIAMLWLCAWALGACSGDEPAAQPAPDPMPDAMISPVLDAGPMEEHMMVPQDPRDAAITEPTPILDLPLVIARPSQPLSTASIDVLVLDPQGLPIPDISVSAGGPSVISDAFGLVRVTSVYGRDTSDVYAFGVVHTLTHARVPIRAGETSQLVLVVAPIRQAKLEDSAAGGMVETEQLLQATFQPASFALPWGGTAKGPSTVYATLLAAPEEAASVPGGMMARIDDALLPVAGVLAVELRVLQGATELGLLADAVLQIPWSGSVPGVEPQQLVLYRFDAKAGAFVPRGTLDATDPTSLRATVDQLGYWLVGTHDAAVHCARAQVQSGGTPLPRAGVVLASTASFRAARVEMDSSGTGCALIASGGELRASALGKLGEQLVSAQGPAVASLEPAMCDEACAASVLQGEPIERGCVTGRLSIPWYGSIQLAVSVTDSLTEDSVTLASNGEFCVDVRQGAEIALPDVDGTCTNGGVVVTAAPATTGASCGGTSAGCTDVGTISCCAEEERCSPFPGDDDCDGMTDEGCACGATDCVWLAATDRCCAADGHCGERATFTGDCVGIESFGIPIGCPSMEIPISEGLFDIAMGCCRSSGECGVMWGSLGCVAAADATKVWGPSVMPQSVACMPTP